MAEQIQARIEIDKEKVGGNYSNFALVHHTENEFIFDFVFMQPPGNIGRVQARIITSPILAKDILNALKENITKYEKKFGRVKKRKIKLPMAAKPAVEPILERNRISGVES